MKSFARTVCALAALGAAACGADVGVEDGFIEEAPTGTDEEVAAGNEEASEACEGDIGQTREALSTASGTRPLLVILLQQNATTPLAHTRAWYDTRVFGPAFPNVPGYFSAMSKNNFTFSRANVISVTDRTDAAFLTRAGVTAGMGSTTATRLRALMLAEDAGFNFKAFDTNNNGTVGTSELAVLSIDNYSSASGQNGTPPCVNHPNVQVCTAVALAGHQSNLVNYVHELSHQLGTMDSYGTNCNSNRETIMSCTGGGVDGTTLYQIDPYHRGELGWLGRSSSVSGASGSMVLQPVSTYASGNTGNERLVLTRGNEKIYIENRRRDTTYERDLAVENVVFWYTQTTADGENIIEIPALSGTGNDGANFTLAPAGCVGDPMSSNSRGRTNIATVAGSTYRMKWLDGTDTGYLFTVGSANANNGVNLSWTQTQERANCPQVSVPAAGFAWVSNGVASTTYSHNSAQGAVTAGTSGTGSYWVRFDGLGRDGGSVQVTAYGSDNVRCKVSSWGRSGKDEYAYVGCHTPAGVAANSNFVVKFQAQNMGSDPAAYFWADQPSSASYNPSSSYSWNSTGGTNRVTRTSAGVYEAYLPGLAVSGGNVQVTAYGSGGAHCKVQGWVTSGTEERVSVRCFNTSGAAADSLFTLGFSGHQQVGLYDNGAYAWASSLTSASYTPSSSYSYDSGRLVGCGGPQTITAGKLAAGSYFMRFTDLSATSSAAQVTAYGSDANYCKVVSWFTSGTGVEVRTQCYNSAGTAADSLYVENYSTGMFRGPC